MKVAPSAPLLIAQTLAAFGSDAPLHAGNVRVGLDVVDLFDFSSMLRSTLGDPFLARAFTAEEREYCGADVQRLGGRWAAKEAVAKAIGSGFRDGLNPSDIVIRHHPKGAPLVYISPLVSWPAEARSWDWSVSIAHEDTIAVAVAIAVLPGEGA